MKEKLEIALLKVVETIIARNHLSNTPSWVCDVGALQSAGITLTLLCFEPTFSEAVASLVPCRFKAMQLRAASWALMLIGGLSVSARSTRLTWPTVVPGKARRELLELGQRMHKPEIRQDMKGQPKEAGRQAGRQKFQ